MELTCWETVSSLRNLSSYCYTEGTRSQVTGQSPGHAKDGLILQELVLWPPLTD